MPRCHYCGQRTRTPHAHAERATSPDTEAVILPQATPPARVPGYRLGALLGQGGFGAVFCAERVSDGDKVAIKVAWPHRRSAAERLQHEALVLDAIGPPHVPRVYECDTLTEGTAYIVLEHIGDPTLASFLEQRAPISPARFLELARALVHAVGAVHRAGFVHLDLKPENIFLNESSAQVTLIDFGLGQVMSSTRHDEPRGDSEDDSTEAGMVLGTVEYMAPEQCVFGAPLDQRADIYALGVLFYELLTARAPFWGPPKTVHLAHQVRRPPPLGRHAPVPRAVERIVMRCLSKRADQRYADTNTLYAALERAAADDSATQPVDISSVRRRPERTQIPMPVMYFRARRELGDIRSALSRYGCALASASGERYTAVLRELSGESPVERMSMAAQGILAMGVSTSATVDFLPVTRRVGPDGSIRYRSAAFSREHVFPARSDTGVLITDDARCALPTRVEVPLFGRDDVLERLLLDASAAADANIPTISTVLAAGGLGKTALASTLKELAQQMIPSATLLSLRASLPAGGESHATLHRLLEWIYDLTVVDADAFQPSDLSSVVGDKLARELGPVLDLAMGWVGPEHSMVRDIAAAPGALRSAMIRLAGEGLRHRAARGPLLLILDDAHMADDITLDALEYATLEEHGLPIWVCVLGRESFERARPAWAVRAGRQRRLSLGPLDSASAAELCRELLKPAEDVAEKVVAALVERSQAIPLLLVELVQGLKRDQIVRRHKATGVWFVASDELDRGSVVPLLTWLGQAELNALPADLAAHARLAAVLGDGFRNTHLGAMLQELENVGLGAEFPLDADAGLSSLRALGVLIPDGQARLRFRHVLLRDAILKMIPTNRRRELHEAAFYACQKLHMPIDAGAGNERLAKLAYHAAQAGLDRQAFEFYLELAEWTRRAHDYIAAERHYTRALELADKSDVIRCMQTARGRALMRYRVGRYEDSLEDFAMALKWSTQQLDREAEIKILLDEATALDWIDRHKQSAKQVFRAQLKAAEFEHSRLIDARLHLGIGRSYWRAGRIEVARAKLGRAIELAAGQGADGYETLADSLLVLGCVLAAQGTMEDATYVFNRVVALCEERGDLFHLAAALNNRRYIWVHLDDIERVLEDANRCIEIGREIGMVGFEYSATYNVAELLYQRGDLDSAWPFVQRAIECEEQRAALLGAGRPLALLLQARMHTYAGHREEAYRLWKHIHRLHTLATRQREKERELSPSEKVLLDMVELSTRDASRAEWDALVGRSERESLESEPSEVVEMMGFWALRCHDSALARECFQQALGLLGAVPTMLDQRIRAALEQSMTASSQTGHSSAIT